MSFNRISVPAPKAPAALPKGQSFTEKELRDIFRRAHENGHEAATRVVPVPMHVTSHQNPFDASSPVREDFGLIADGVCGFAYVILKPARGRAANVFKEMFTNVRPGYYGGLSMSVMNYRQSLTRKEAYADAFAAICREYGLNVHSESRID